MKKRRIQWSRHFLTIKLLLSSTLRIPSQWSRTNKYLLIWRSSPLSRKGSELVDGGTDDEDGDEGKLEDSLTARLGSSLTTRQAARLKAKQTASLTTRLAEMLAAS